MLAPFSCLLLIIHDTMAMHGLVRLTVNNEGIILLKQQKLQEAVHRLLGALQMTSSESKFSADFKKKSSSEGSMINKPLIQEVNLFDRLLRFVGMVQAPLTSTQWVLPFPMILIPSKTILSLIGCAVFYNLAFAYHLAWTQDKYHSKNITSALRCYVWTPSVATEHNH